MLCKVVALRNNADFLCMQPDVSYMYLCVCVCVYLYIYFSQENVDDLLLSVTKDVGFSQNKPVAAITIFRCLMQWKSFEADRTSVFDRIIQTIGSSIEVNYYYYLLKLNPRIHIL